MRRDFTQFEDLISFVETDKNISGANAGVANRFPVRFVLFDNFQDSYRFTSDIQMRGGGCKFKDINGWIDVNYPDTILTYSELADRIIALAQTDNNDMIITPFSELARFYNNLEPDHREFDALIRTIKGIENNSRALAHNRRIYIPIVGLEGKMSLLDNDTQSTIWYLKNSDKSLTYNLILTDGTYFDINDISPFNIAQNVQQWLDVWKAQPEVKPDIICSSPSIYANAHYAQPDNAFNFIICDNAHKFLVDGLHLDFGEVIYKKSDDDFWHHLAHDIDDIKNFSFDNFFNGHFMVSGLNEGCHVFIKLWFEFPDDYNRWLLTTYYVMKKGVDNYISKVIASLESFSNIEFFTKLTLKIFEPDNRSINNIFDREVCLYAASQHGIKISEDSEESLEADLVKIAENEGYSVAARYFSSLTIAEKKLALLWLASDRIKRTDILDSFPDLHRYTEEYQIGEPMWLASYLQEYRKAKLSNKYSQAIETFMQERNATPIKFDSWYQELKTTKTILSERADIDIYYWIDGLGAEWIPYITNYFHSKNKEGIYLNELFMARAIYPTTTANNKKQLLELSNNALQKCGDLDSHAHLNTNKYPEYIIEEFDIIRNALDQITAQYNGKKIAIVSDHGLTALSQMQEGLNLGGIESDHHGRLAFAKGTTHSNNNYIVCEDTKTLCALTHHSLCGKIPQGQSAHGGCTPEETIVPIFVISSQKENTSWTATLLTQEISEISPILRYRIIGVSAADEITIEYNGGVSKLKALGNSLYESVPLSLTSSAKDVILRINDKQQKNHIEIRLGAEEEDLLSF